MGCFAGGASPCGCEELSGNVWEWTRSNFEGYPYQTKCENLAAGADRARVLRGGAFYDGQRFVRCASCDRYDPHLRHYDVGFRVLLSSFNISLNL